MHLSDNQKHIQGDELSTVENARGFQGSMFIKKKEKKKSFCTEYLNLRTTREFLKPISRQRGTLLIF